MARTTPACLHAHSMATPDVGEPPSRGGPVRRLSIRHIPPKEFCLSLQKSCLGLFYTSPDLSVHTERLASTVGANAAHLLPGEQGIS